MKANEIVIDDWVRRRWTCSDTGREVVKDFQVGEVRKNGETLYVWRSEGGNMGRVEQMEPIPLTPEILEKNGFSQDPLNGHIFIFHEKSGEVIYYEYGQKYGLTIDNQLATIQDLKIKYVHELQHALRLCGIELNIVV